MTGSGKIESATGPNPEKRASASFSSLLGGRRSVSMRFSVRMAAMMSRALAFSPLATGDCRCEAVRALERLGIGIAGLVGVTGGGGVWTFGFGRGLFGRGVKERALISRCL